MDKKAANQSVILVTGMSGAGRSTALKVLEDLGYEAVDNLPLSLLASLVQPRPASDAVLRPLAIGVDIRTRDFGVEFFIDELDRLIAQDDLRYRVQWESRGKQHDLGAAAGRQPFALRFIINNGALFVI